MKSGDEAFPQQAGGSDRLRASVRILLIVVYVLLACSLAVALLINRNEALREGQRSAETLAFILGDHLVRTVSGIDTTLTQLVHLGGHVGGPNARNDAWQGVLDAAKSGVSGIAVLAVLDETGVIRHATAPQIIGQSRSDTFLYSQLSTDANAGLVVDKPLRGRLTGRWVIPFGRRMADADGKFVGIVVATLEPEQLRTFYRSITAGRTAVISVLHPERSLLFREPSSQDVTGEIAPDITVSTAQKSDPAERLARAPLRHDGPMYLTVYQAVENPPLTIAVSLAESEILSGWWTSVIVSGALFAAFGILLIFAWRMFSRELCHRSEVEARLLAQTTDLASAVRRHGLAETALRAKDAQFQSIMDHAPVMVSLRDLDGRFTFINRSYVQFARQSEESILGRTVAELRSPEYAESIAVQDQHVIDRKRAMQWEMAIPKPDGMRNAFIVKFPVFDADGQLVSVGTILADVTEQKRAEGQIVQAQRIEALGQLTGGIAHDFNNLLTSILLNADVLASVADDNQRPLAEAVRMAAERGADLTRRLLAVGRRQMLAPRPTDIRQLIAGMLPLMHRTIGEHIEVSTVNGAGLWFANVDPSQLENAVLNLAANARDAMPKGGRLTIECTNAELSALLTDAMPASKPGDYVMIAVHDTGSGMPPAIVTRAFEPFFTTKDVGKGTGLGLSMVHGFMNQSGGQVRIDSKVGTGTTVRLYLPRTTTSPELEDESPAIAPEPLRGTETILFVEDDPMVRQHTGKQIVGLGYAVVAAENASEAIAQVSDGCVPDLLFTDVVMPGGMNGQQLALKLRERWPRLRVLYTSGYAHGQLTIDGEPVPSRYVLGKPYRRADLAAKLRDVLDEPGA